MISSGESALGYSGRADHASYEVVRLARFDTTGLRDRLPVDYRDGENRATGWLEMRDVIDIVATVEQLVHAEFVSVAYQAYRDGTATTPWHADDYDVQAMLSIGATRTFGVRNGDGEHRFPVVDGDIVVLTGREEHAVLPDPDQTDERCSLVFRTAGAPMSPKLATVGFKLAVLGVTEPPTDWWHILRPGTFNVPQVGDQGVTRGRALCGRTVLTNGYAADFTPECDLCPACREQL